jgi:hypothetical protein
MHRFVKRFRFFNLVESHDSSCLMDSTSPHSR